MLDGKIVLVTGATRGIGKAIALTLGNSGATIIGTATSELGADNISKMLGDNKISGEGIVLDVTNNDQISNLDEIIKKDFGMHFIIIDCSPSLGIVTVNSLVASDSVIIPVQCEYFALEGLGKLLETIKLIQNDLNKKLTIEGILMSMYDVRLRLSNQVVEEVQTHFKNLVFNTPENT